MAISSIAPYETPCQASWPNCRAPWTFDATRAALLIHDAQEYFLRPFLPERPPLAPMLRHIRRMHRAFRNANRPVVFTAQPGEQSRDERGLLWDLWGPGIISNPSQQQLVSGLVPGGGDIMIHKRRYSAFHETELLSVLNAHGAEQLVISGVYAHIGCLATATDGFMRGIQPFLVADATADFSEQDHQVALRQVARTCGVVVATDTVLGQLRETMVRNALAPLVDAQSNLIALDDDLADHGLDSIRFMQLLEQLLPPMHGLDFQVLVEARSIRALTRLLERTEEAERSL